MRYTFCTIDAGASTAWLRAGMIVEFMKAEKKRECRWIFGEKNIEESLKSADKNDCYIYVKTGYKDDLILKSKEKCGKLILDISDDFSEVKTNIWSTQADAVLYDTDSTCRLLENRGYKNILKIKHLHSNFDKNFNQVRKRIDGISKIGYLGLDKQLDNSKEIVKFVTDMGFGWYQASPNPVTNNFHSLQLDLKVIYSLNKENLSTKPHNKIMNIYSYGIPSLYSPYESYIETIADNQILQWYCCSSLEDIFEKLKSIITNPALYKKASDEAFLLSQNFHISKYEDCYKNLFKFVE